MAAEKYRELQATWAMVHGVQQMDLDLAYHDLERSGKSMDRAFITIWNDLERSGKLMDCAFIWSKNPSHRTWNRAVCKLMQPMC